MASKKKNSSKLYLLNWILVFAILLFIALIVFYFSNIFKLDNIQKADWGTFGDFVGGTLNPLFALFSLFAIIYTIKIQTQELEYSREELEATRKELKESRIAQQEQSESLKLQNDATKLQIFENTFFKLFEQHNKMLDNCRDSHGNIYILNFKSTRQNEYGELLEDVSKDELIHNFKNTNEHNAAIKNYFMTFYQLLKFIDIQSTNKNFDPKLYTNMIRSILNHEILKGLAVNIVAYKEFIKYKEFVENFALFEHLYLDENDNSKLLFEVLIEYEPEAFGNNIKILDKYFELKNILNPPQNSAFVEAKV